MRAGPAGGDGLDKRGGGRKKERKGKMRKRENGSEISAKMRERRGYLKKKNSVLALFLGLVWALVGIGE